MFFTYILESVSTGQLYIGQTNNIEDRLKRHNSGRNKSTKSKAPWILLHQVSFKTRAEAAQLERKLKRWKNPTRVKEWIEKQK